MFFDETIYVVFVLQLMRGGIQVCVAYQGEELTPEVAPHCHIPIEAQRMHEQRDFAVQLGGKVGP
jgi:hypothetical protein